MEKEYEPLANEYITRFNSVKINSENYSEKISTSEDEDICAPLNRYNTNMNRIKQLQNTPQKVVYEQEPIEVYVVVFENYFGSVIPYGDPSQWIKVFRTLREAEDYAEKIGEEHGLDYYIHRDTI